MEAPQQARADSTILCHLRMHWTDTPKVDEEIPSREGVPAIPVRIYTPRNNSGDLPLVVFFHGGGYLSGRPSPNGSLGHAAFFR